MHKPDLEDVLTRHLGRVAAPEELWERIESPQVLAKVPTRHAKVRALLVLTALIIIGVVFQTRRKTVEVEYRPQHAAACFLCHAGG